MVEKRKRYIDSFSFPARWYFVSITKRITGELMDTVRGRRQGSQGEMDVDEGRQEEAGYYLSFNQSPPLY